MLTNTKLFILAFSFVVMFTSCSKDQEVPEVRLTLNAEAELGDNVSYSKMEVTIMDAVNAHRKSLGMNALIKADDITFQADEHTNYMISNNVVNHDNFDKRYRKLVEEIGARAVSENVAYGYHTAEAVFQAWLDSEGHRKNIEGDYTHFGISVEQGPNGRNYFTNIFVRR
jgi:uncharacterized protein YkwD